MSLGRPSLKSINQSASLLNSFLETRSQIRFGSKGCATPANFPPQVRSLAPLPRPSGLVSGRRREGSGPRTATGCSGGAGAHPAARRPRCPLGPAGRRARRCPGPPLRRRAGEGWVWRPGLPSGQARPPLGSVTWARVGCIPTMRRT